MPVSYSRLLAIEITLTYRRDNGRIQTGKDGRHAILNLNTKAVGLRHKKSCLSQEEHVPFFVFPQT